MSTTTMTVTVMSAGEMVYFPVEIEKEKFNEAVEMAGLLMKPSDVALVEEMGIWKVIH